MIALDLHLSERQTEQSLVSIMSLDGDRPHFPYRGFGWAAVWLSALYLLYMFVYRFLPEKPIWVFLAKTLPVTISTLIVGWFMGKFYLPGIQANQRDRSRENSDRKKEDPS